jgi:Ser/Thr protein kinase RdoA (MazF antagonist)
MDTTSLEPRLRELLGGRGELEVRALKHVPGKRCVLAYEFTQSGRAIGKLYRKDRAERVGALISCLGAALHGATRVPRLLACYSDLGLVLQEWVPGEPVTYSGFGTSPELLDRLGRALAELHSAPVQVGPRADLASHVRRTCHPGLAALREALPEHAAALQLLETETYAREHVAAGGVTTCHGDFSPGQIFTDAEHVYLVDLDGMCQGDPALDVANFRVGLRAHAEEAGEDAGDRFLAAYLEARGLGELPSLPHYEAFCELRRAVILWRKRPSEWEELLRRGIRRGEVALGLATTTELDRARRDS